jgi:DNA-binding NarL/FixJ family response regulator
MTMTMPADDRARRNLPERIGRYQVIERIGRGAMGVVYRAHDSAMGRDVALKVLTADLEDDPDIQVIGEAGTGVDAIHMAEKFCPRVVVMDMSMPGLDGVQATREILKKAPSTAVLILSMYSEENYVRNALDAGARGYLLKEALDVDLAGAIKDLAAGKNVQ